MTQMLAIAGALEQRSVNVPALLQETLTPVTTMNDWGSVVAVSDDGDTVAVSGNDATPSSQTVSVFVRSGSPAAWSLQTVIANPGSVANFGVSLALSADGNTLLIGHNATTNAVYVYARSGSSWSLQQSFSGSVTGGNFGISVALSSDGNRAVIGAPGQTNGFVYVFDRSGSTWTQSARFTRTGVATGEKFGQRVAISRNGLYVVGMPDRSSTYSVAIFFYNGSTWAQQTQFATTYGDQAMSAVIDETGTYCFVSISEIVHIYKRSSTTWSSPIQLITHANHLGNVLSCTPDGRHLTAVLQNLVTDPPRPFGYAALYRAINESWNFIGAPPVKRQLDGENTINYMGVISADGKTLVSGAPAQQCVYILTTSDNL
jgi:hypothetical protein